MKTKTCYLLFCIAWVAGFVCLLYYVADGIDIGKLTAYALFLIAAAMGCRAMGCSCCNTSCCKKED